MFAKPANEHHSHVVPFSPTLEHPWRCPQGPPLPDFQAHGGTLLLRTHLMERPFLALTLEQWEEPACWAQHRASCDGWDFSPEETTYCCSRCCSRIALTPDLCANSRCPGLYAHRAGFSVTGWACASPNKEHRLWVTLRGRLSAAWPDLSHSEGSCCWELTRVRMADLGPCSPGEGE